MSGSTPKTRKPKALTPKVRGQKLTTSKASSINSLPAKSRQKLTTPQEPENRVSVACQGEIQGIGMGVLTDGTPFLTQRGLGRLCGIDHTNIGTIRTEWDISPQPTRISKIKDLLTDRGIEGSPAHIEVEDQGATIYAYPDTVCLAVLEYYAFDAGKRCKADARKNYRLLAGKALHDFIYAQVGYDPDNRVPDVWKKFHDRVSLTYNAVPRGFFSVFKEIADLVVTLGQAGLHIDDTFVPDISVGLHWAKHWADRGMDQAVAARRRYQHNYPAYFPQSLSNPQRAWCYPNAALGDFREWFESEYLRGGRFRNYMESKVKQSQLTVSFVQLAIAAYEPPCEPAH